MPPCGVPRPEVTSAILGRTIALFRRRHKYHLFSDSWKDLFYKIFYKISKILGSRLAFMKVWHVVPSLYPAHAYGGPIRSTSLPPQKADSRSRMGWTIGDIGAGFIGSKERTIRMF